MTLLPDPSSRAAAIAGRCAGFEWRTCLRRLLVIGEDEAERRRIAGHFTAHGCAVLQAGVATALHRLAAGRIGLVVLDLDTPGSAGTAMLDAIRLRSCVPVIVTTPRGSGEECVASLEAGADDILRRPFDPDELVARARAVLRRQTLGRMAMDSPAERGFRFHGWELRERTRILHAPDGGAVALTRTEYALLAAFLRAPGRPLSRMHLIRATRAQEDLADRSVDVQVTRLRRKLTRGPSAPRLIGTVRGLGYSFDAAVEVLA